MEIIDQLEQVVYQYREEKDWEDNFLWLVKERQGDTIRFVPLCKGWLYTLYSEIGTRGGLAEAGELLVGGEKVSIEQYIDLSRAAIAAAQPIKTLFERFSVTARAWKKADAKDWIVKTIEQDMRLPVVDTDPEGTVRYQKRVTTGSEVALIYADAKNDTHAIWMEFEEICESCGEEFHVEYPIREMIECSNCGYLNCPDCLSYDPIHCYECGEALTKSLQA